MASYDIPLLEEGDPNSGFRTKNDDGTVARAVLVDRGDALIARAVLTSVTHGQFTPDGDPATLLIFEFTFISMKASRRFKSGKVTLTFDDSSGNAKNRPEVFTLAPAGKFVINKTTSVKDVKQSFNATIKPEVFNVAGGDLGYIWEATGQKEIVHATTLSGIKRVGENSNRDNRVIWTVEEDQVEQKGIPSFLRAAVLLRRRDDVRFCFNIQVETGVDFEGKIKRLLGLVRPDPVDPVELDDATDLEDLGIASLDPATVDLTEMRQMDITKHADVMIATLLSVPA